MHYDGFKIEAHGETHLGFSIDLKFHGGTIHYDSEGNLDDDKINKLHKGLTREIKKIDESLFVDLTDIETISEADGHRRDTNHVIGILIGAKHRYVKIGRVDFAPNALRDARDKIEKAQNDIEELQKTLSTVLKRMEKQIQNFDFS